MSALLLKMSARRLMSSPGRLALSIAAIACGVAVVTAVLTLNTGPQRMFEKLAAVGGGQASAVARTSSGFPDTAYKDVSSVTGVKAAAPILDLPVRLVNGTESVSVRLVGMDSRVRDLASSNALPRFLDRPTESAIGLYLNEGTADRLGVSNGANVSVEIGDRKSEVLVASDRIGDDSPALNNLPIALAPLGTAQSLTGMQGRLTRIALKLDSELAVETTENSIELATGRKADVRDIAQETALYNSATRIERDVARLFSILAIIVSALLVFAVASAEAIARKSEWRDLSVLGAARSTLLTQRGIEATLVGLIAGIVGVALGTALSRSVGTSGLDYLSSAFVIGTETTPTIAIAISAILLGIGASLAASISASAASIVEATDRDDDGLRNKSGAQSHVKPARRILGTALFAAGMVLGVARPAAADIGVGIAALGGALWFPDFLRSVLLAMQRRIPTPGGAGFMGVTALNASPTRSTILAGATAVCIGAVVFMGGAASGLKSGISALSANMFTTADLWISIDSPQNNIGTEPFESEELDRITDLPEIERALDYRLSFLDLEERRVLVIAYAPENTRNLSGSEFISGDRPAMEQGLSRRGDIALSEDVAESLNVEVGDRLSLPTPSGPMRSRYAATINNYGWQAGSIAIGKASFEAFWQDDQESMVGLQLASGTTAADARRTIKNSLGDSSTFRIESAAAGVHRGERNVEEGLSRLGQIRIAVIAGSSFALIAVLAASALSRRREFVVLRTLGMSAGQLRRQLAVEIGSSVAIGATIGAVFGVIAQALFIQTFRSIGYPATFEFEAGVLPLVGMSLIALVLPPLLVASRTILRYDAVEALRSE